MIQPELSVAVVQTTSTDNVDDNLQQIFDLFSQIKDPVRLICLPENCLYMRIKENQAIEGLKLEHAAFKTLANEARKRNAYIHLGSVPLINGKLRNSSVIISPSGEVLPSYDKLHLFDIDLDGEKRIRESDIFSHGEKPRLLEVDGWQIGQTICYDLRFAELFSAYAAEGVELILVPAAFLPTTGKAHWEILLRARAIESQCYVIAAAQCGIHRSSQTSDQRQTHGHSLIIDPWGAVLAEGSAEKTGVFQCKLPLKRIQDVRRQIPMKHHRRLLQVKR